jgi:hypothetical protein
MNQATVVILLSDKRSGSTILEKELCKHTLVKHVNYTPHSYNETHFWLNAACTINTPKQLFANAKRPKSYGSQQLAKSLLIDLIKGNVPEFESDHEEEAFIFRAWDTLCEQNARPVFFEKSPQHIHHWAALDLLLRWLEQCPYQVRVIGLVRNPMAVMYSAKKLFYTDPEQRQFGWAEAYRNLLVVENFLPTEQYKCIRYEDLIKNSKSTLRELCSFIGVDYEQGLGDDIHTDSQNSWRAAQDFSLQLHPSVKRVAQHFGYDAEALFNPEKPGINRISEQLGLSCYRFYTQAYNKAKRILTRLR